MKRILILIPSFGLGGTNSSLLSFLSKIDPKQISVDVFSLYHSGVMRNMFPNCRVLKENIWLSMSIKEEGLIKITANNCIQNLRRVCKRIGLDLYPLYGKIIGAQLRTREYDALCSFQEDLSHLLSCIPARKRIAWIRCEYSRYFNVYKTDESKYYKRIDEIIAVSEFTKKAFCDFYPSFAYKTKVINNFLDEDYIINQSKIPVEFHDKWLPGVLKIISVGRIDAVKQFDRIPEIVSMVLKNRPNSKLVWIIIGSGDLKTEKQVEDRIIAYKLQDYIIHIPAKENVFPWVATADLFVHTSKSETFSRVVNEAKALNVPVLINDYGCADEFVENDVDGWIVPIDVMWNKIIEILDNPIMLREIKDKLKETHYDNDRVLSQILEVI